MGIADPDAALVTLREFRQLHEQADRGWDEGVSEDVYHAINHLSLLVDDIARALGTNGIDAGGYDHANIIDEIDQLIGKLERHEDYGRIFGPVGPTLAASGLHAWVWHAAVNLWDGGHHKQAVNAAAAAVEEQTQLKLDRGDLSGADLYTQAFKVGKVGEVPDGRRLRFTHLDELTEDGKRNQSWVSAHEGAMHFGRGCAQGIRNLNAHGTGDLPEQEALEYLASLSVLARWVHMCQAEPVS